MSSHERQRTPQDHPHERATDRGWLARIASRFGVRDFVSLLAVLFAGYAAVGAYNQGQDIQEGRRAGSGLTCAAASALTEGGRRFVIQSAAAQTSPELEKFLRQFGYPTLKERKASARVAGDAYVSFISDSIVDRVGPQARGIVTRGGFDCNKFQAIARIPK